VLHILVPVESWLQDHGRRQWLRLAAVAYVLVPLVFLVGLGGSGNLSAPGWAYSLYVAPLWAFTFWLLVRPGSLGRLEVGLGAAIAGWVLIWMNAVTIRINNHLDARSVLQALGAGLNEETTKAMPVLIAALVMLLWRQQKLSVRMWMFLGSLSGLTFGVVEQAYYTSGAIYDIARGIVPHNVSFQGLFYPSAAVRGSALDVRLVLELAERVFFQGAQHAVWAAISAFFIGMAVNCPRRRVELLVLAFSVPAVLHAANDWVLGNGLSPWVWTGVQALSLLLLLGYTMSAQSIERGPIERGPIERGPIERGPIERGPIERGARAPMPRGGPVPADGGSPVPETEPASTPWAVLLGWEKRRQSRGGG
jgi:RsiW-degrading membrane proteinase PrsW (M82 family)